MEKFACGGGDAGVCLAVGGDAVCGDLEPVVSELDAAVEFEEWELCDKVDVRAVGVSWTLGPPGRL